MAKVRQQFRLPKYRKGDKVKTKDGIGVIKSISNEGKFGFFYIIDDKVYSEIEIIE
jgi:hypothetical protein